MPDLTPIDPPSRTANAWLERTCVWSPGIPPVVELFGLPVIPCAQNGRRRPVRAAQLTGHDPPLLAWAWITPGDDRALRALGSRLVADVELAGWDGSPDELDDAEALAAVCPAVTTHGYLKDKLRDVLVPFAEAGAVVLPQVYDSDQSTTRMPGGPAAFLRKCVAMYRDLGFVRVVPLLGTAAGVPHLRAWRAACLDLGLPFHLWAYGQILHDPAVTRWVRQLGEGQPPAPSPAPSPPPVGSPSADPRGGEVS